MRSESPLPHLIVGLTGGIGSGKSTVAKLFEHFGARIIDTDLISHQLTQSGGAAITAICRIFGSEYLDTSGSMDRNKMRTLVFIDATAKKKLESILHPLIREQAELLAAHPTTAPYTIVVVPLLAEFDNYQWLQRITVIDCSEQTQIDRTIQRSGLKDETVRAIMATQSNRAQRLQIADDIIDNDGPVDHLQQQIELLNRNYLQIASGSD
jgi:dephospho-CoA kinase